LKNARDTAEILEKILVETITGEAYSEKNMSALFGIR